MPRERGLSEKRQALAREGIDKCSRAEALFAGERVLYESMLQCWLARLGAGAAAHVEALRSVGP